MKHPWLLLFASIITFIQCRNNSITSVDNKTMTFADSLFQSHIDSSHIAGGAVKILQQGKIILDKTYGFASLELEHQMPANASFEIGSVTKQFTATGILKLVEEGKLSLEDDITKYLEFDTRGQAVSIAQLLNHTSGIPSYTEIPAFWTMSVQKFDRDTLVKIIEQEDFLFEPGESLIYNNSAYFFLGLIIEKVVGKSYEDFLKEQFFLPLGMKDTYYCSTSKVTKGKAYGYNFTPDGLEQKSYLDHTWPYAAGSLCSTTSDLMIWMKALHDGKVLRPEFYELLINPQNLNDGTPVRYASGLANFSNYGHHTIAHGGGINGFLSETRYFPEDELIIICLINTTGPQGAGFFADALTWHFLDKIETKKSDIDIDLQPLKGRYTGQVRGRKISVDINSMENAISQTVDGSTDTLYTYIGNNTWMDGNETIVINNDEYRTDQIYGYYILKKEK